LLICFFFQAEDGIRDDLVTGVQTVLFRSERVRRGDCGRQGEGRVRRSDIGRALRRGLRQLHHYAGDAVGRPRSCRARRGGGTGRSEERRVGREGRGGVGDGGEWRSTWRGR